MSRTAAFLAVAVVMATPAIARADTPPTPAAPAAPSAAPATPSPGDLAQAKVYFNAGAQAYSAGRYDVAVAAFAQAYKLVPRPPILFSMAQAERKAWYVGRQADVVASAVHHYHEYLGQVPTGGRRTDAADALAELEPLAARLAPAPSVATPSAPSGTQIMISSPVSSASVSVDGAETCEVPFMQAVQPGKHKVIVSAPGYFDEEREVVALAGATVPSEVALRERPARVTLATNAHADVVVDGRTLGTTPMGRPLELLSGAHFVELTRNGYKAYAREITVERDKATTLDVRFEASPQRVASYALLGAGVVALAAGGAFAGVSLVQQNDAQQVLDTRAVRNISEPEREGYVHAIDLRDAWRTAAAASLGVGVVALSVGAVLYAFDRPVLTATPPAPRENVPRAPREMEMSLVPTFGPGAAGAAWSGTF